MSRRTPLRRDVRLTYANALLWAIGNGLAPTFLVGYLAMDLGAGSAAIAWLVAAPRFAGLLRLAAPHLLAAWARRGVERKTLCLVGYVGSGLVLAAVPLAVWGVDESASAGEKGIRVALLVIAWCGYHLLEYLATIFLWSWIGDIYPARLRSRLLGVRERCLTMGRAGGIGTTIVLASAWGWLVDKENVRTPLAVSSAAGAALMLVAVAPIALMSCRRSTPSARPRAGWRITWAPMADRAYRRLLAYHAWLAFANGITGTAVATYPYGLGVSYSALQTWVASMWLGQAALAPRCGRIVQRFGAKRLMLPAQLLVATGPLCFYFADATHWQWIAVAYGVWIAFVALNVSLDSLKIGLAERTNNSPYLAMYDAVGQLTNGLTIVAGGMLYEILTARDERSQQVYAWLFLAGFVCRLLAAPLIARLIEPAVPSQAHARSLT